MSPSPEPTPTAPVEPPPLPVAPRGRLGWLGHLTILTTWIAGAAIIAFFRKTGHVSPAVGSAAGVLWRTAVSVPIFALFCGGAWFCSRATLTGWRLRWSGGLGPLWLGALYSVAIRMGVAILGVAVFLLVREFHPVDARTIRELRPQVENAVSLPALATDRAFFWLVVTLLSGLAGLLEEVWRGGMLAGLAGAFPRMFGGQRGSWIAIFPTAALFGLAHLYMGWLAMAGAMVLGCLLGAIMVWHRTIWHAVIAHWLFDATSFAALAWTLRHTHLLGR